MRRMSLNGLPYISHLKTVTSKLSNYSSPKVRMLMRKVFMDIPLWHYALGKDRNEIVELLIAKGADVNAKDDGGNTPLHFTTTKEIAELLIAENADVNTRDDVGRTPLDSAATKSKKETADLLRKHGGKTGEELKAEGK